MNVYTHVVTHYIVINIPNTCILTIIITTTIITIIITTFFFLLKLLLLLLFLLFTRFTITTVLTVHITIWPSCKSALHIFDVVDP